MSVKTTEVIIHRVCDICGDEHPDKELTELRPATGRKGDAADVCTGCGKKPIESLIDVFAKRGAAARKAAK
jgi:hypothetical protein